MPGQGEIALKVKLNKAGEKLAKVKQKVKLKS